MNTLQDRFCALWDRNTSPDFKSDSADLFRQLETLYMESWRAYHNLDHIKACLDVFDTCKSHADQKDSIELAIWFHDCIYTVGSADNEARSKQWFLDKSEHVLAEALRQTVAQLIMDTCHRYPPDTNDGKLLSDIDLSSFSLPWDQYVTDGRNVEREITGQEPVAGPIHKTGFIEMLLTRDSIYFSDYFLEHRESLAQKNIQRHLALVDS